MHTKCQKRAFWRWYGQRSECAVLLGGFATFKVRKESGDMNKEKKWLLWGLLLLMGAVKMIDPVFGKRKKKKKKEN